MSNARRSALAAGAAMFPILAHGVAAQPAAPGPGAEPGPAVTGAPPPYDPAAMPSPPRQPGIDANFVSATAMPWEVMVDQQSACVTPCRLILERPSWITMRTRENSPIRLEVGQLGTVPTIVTAHDVQNGKYATGIVFTTFGGMALVTGITLGAVGYGRDREGLKTAGLITGVSGAAMTFGGIWLMRNALPRTVVRVLDQRGLALAPAASGAGAAVHGTF